MGQMGQMEHQKLSLHTASSSNKSRFAVRNGSEMVGQMGQMEDKWEAICPDKVEDKWCVGL
jgi:hypothetical protein